MMRTLSIAVAFFGVASANLKKKYYAPIKTCPTGYSLQGKVCNRTLYLEEELSCVTGQIEGDYCVEYFPKEKVCPAGWTLNGKDCSRTNYEEAEAVCDVGDELVGNQCVSWVEVPLVSQCSIGSLHGDWCEWDDEEEAGIECPDNAEWSKGQCYKRESYECVSSKGSYGRWLGKHKHGRKHHGTWNKQPSYHKKEIVPAKSWCTRLVPTGFSYVCGHGWVLDGDMCYKTNMTPANFVCPNGGSSKECFSRSSAPAEFRCPLGFQQDVQNGCHNTEWSDAHYECPSWADERGDQCVQLSAASAWCSEGKSDGNGRCVRFETVEPVIASNKKY